MEYRRLGKSGLQISALSLGTWISFGDQMDIEEASKCMAIAYDAGINFFDSAEMYNYGQSEIILGRAFKKLGWRRDSYLVSSKVYYGAVPNPKPNQYGLSRKHIFEACHQALKRLQVDYLDLYFCHYPDPNVPIEESVRAMSDLVQQGKVLYWGTSNWSAQQIMQAYSVARLYNLVPPTMEQPRYNMFHRHQVETEYKRLYEEIGLGLTTWSPLYSGILTGKYNDGIPPNSRLSLESTQHLRDRMKSETNHQRLAKVRTLTQIADELGATMAQLALAWCLRKNHISSIITGVSRLEQLLDNVKALDVVPLLTPDVLDSIDGILDNVPQPQAIDSLM